MYHSIIKLSFLSQTYYVIIDHDSISPGNGREVLDGLNDTKKQFLFQLITTLKLPGSKGYGTQRVMYSSTYTADVSLAQEF